MAYRQQRLCWWRDINTHDKRSAEQATKLIYKVYHKFYLNIGEKFQCYAIRITISRITHNIPIKRLKLSMNQTVSETFFRFISNKGNKK